MLISHQSTARRLGLLSPEWPECARLQRQLAGQLVRNIAVVVVVIIITWYQHTMR